MLERAVIWIYAAGIFQAVFLSLSLLTLKIRNRTAAYALSAMMALLAIALVEQIADSAGAATELALGLAMEFGLAPLLYIFIRSIAEPNWSVTKQTALHFIPMGLALCLLALMHGANHGGNLGIAHDQFGGVITAWVFVKLIYFSLYAFSAERLLRKVLQDAKGARATSLRWIYRWLLLVIAAFGVSYFTFILFLLGVPIWRDSDVYAGIVMFAVIFSIAYFVLANRKVLDQAPQKQSPATAATIQNADLIAGLMQSERLHLDPEFSIEALSMRTRLGANAINTAIAHLTGGGFNEYLNTVRLKEFDVLAIAPENKTKTTLELAYAAGFNSKATFYRVFNAAKKMTPRDYRQNLQSA